MNVLSVDLNYYSHRAALLDGDGQVLRHYVAKPKEPASRWLERVLAHCAGHELTVIGSPLDEWPGSVVDGLSEIGTRLQWLNPSLIRRLFSVCRPWNLHRKIHRARLLGHLYLTGATSWDAETAARQFEALVAREILMQLETDS